MYPLFLYKLYCECTFQFLTGICYNNFMDKQKKFSSKTYSRRNPSKAKILKEAVKQAVKQYEETFRRLATT